MSVEAHQAAVQHLARRIAQTEVELANAVGALAETRAELAELRTTGELLAERIAATVPE